MPAWQRLPKYRILHIHRLHITELDKPELCPEHGIESKEYTDLI